MSKPPHDLDSELALLGDLIGLPHRLGEVLGLVGVGDFYSPANATVFAALVTLHQTGHPITNDSLRDELARSKSLDQIGGVRFLAEVGVLGSGAWKKHASTVANHAALRRVMMLASELRESAADPSSDPAVLVAEALRDLGGVQLPSV